MILPLLAAAAVASAPPPPEPTTTMVFTNVRPGDVFLHLTREELGELSAAEAERPFKVAAPFIADISQQLANPPKAPGPDPVKPEPKH